MASRSRRRRGSGARRARAPRRVPALARPVGAFVVLLGVSTLAVGGLARLYAPDRPVDLTPTRDVGLPAEAVAPAAVGDVRPAPVSRSSDRPAVDPAWLRRTAAKAGIPEVALRAYASAQLSGVGGCDVGWTTLAGIGWVESHHGTIGGRALEADGRSQPPIIGPALDGTRGFKALRSTPESAAWHGDARWEHAVGPMQFLRSSWDRWGADGDGDGVADPLDLDDAAAATARYLCADGHDLATGAGWSAAIYSYNHSDVYVRDVYAAASAYAQRTG